jgi:photosystem II stability/assembly factor-like uncharacterized protein
VWLLVASAAAAATDWVSIGPSPVVSGTHTYSGRVTAVAVDPGDPKHWLIGGAGGGIWSTNDSGKSWKARMDGRESDALADASLAIGAIAFAPGDALTVYAGTGGSASLAGTGLLKSTDGGKKWKHVAGDPFAGTSFSAIGVHPKDATLLVAATTFGAAAISPYLIRPRPATGNQYGVYKSKNGGLDWSPAPTLAGRTAALVVDPANFDHQYAALAGPQASAATLVHRSLDGADTWQAIANPPWAAIDLGKTVLDTVGLAVAPSNPDVAYVVMSIGTGIKVWKTENAWDVTPKWVSLPDVPSGSASLGPVSVDPVKPQVLYVGAHAFQEFSRDLYAYDGSAWTDRDEVHADPRALAWVGTRLVVGNDGGVYSSPDGGKNFDDHNAGLSLAQFYSGALHPGRPNFAIAGAQDHGLVLWRGGLAWELLVRGDGMAAAFSPSNPDTDWLLVNDGSGQTVQLARNAGLGLLPGGAGLETSLDKRAFPPRLRACPADGNVVLIGAGAGLWKTTNFFAGDVPTWAQNASATSVGGLAFAPSDPTCGTYAYATAQPQIFLTRDGGQHWRPLVDSAESAWGFVTDLAFDPKDPAILYASLSNYRSDKPSDQATTGVSPRRVVKTTDALADAIKGPVAFTDVTPFLPGSSTKRLSAPANALAFDASDPSKPTLYLGTNQGLWASTDGAKTWTLIGPEQGVPIAVVTYVSAEANTGRVIAYTYGRGAFARIPPGAPTADVALQKSMSEQHVEGVLQLACELTATNAGPDDAQNLTVVDGIPPETTVEANQWPAADGGECSFVAASGGKGGKVTCTWPGNIPAGQTRSATIRLTVLADTPDGAKVINRASATADTADPDGSNNRVEVTWFNVPPVNPPLLEDPFWFLKLLDVLSAAFFVSVALWVTLVAQARWARMAAPAAVEDFRRTYRQLAPWQASAAIVGLACGGLVSLFTSAWGWGIGGLLLGSVVPFTLVAMAPTNGRLLATTSADEDGHSLLKQWGRLHVLRTVLAAAGLAVMLWAAVR